MNRFILIFSLILGVSVGLGSIAWAEFPDSSCKGKDSCKGFMISVGENACNGDRQVIPD